MSGILYRELLLFLEHRACSLPGCLMDMQVDRHRIYAPCVTWAPNMSQKTFYQGHRKDSVSHKQVYSQTPECLGSAFPKVYTGAKGEVSICRERDESAAGRCCGNPMTQVQTSFPPRTRHAWLKTTQLEMRTGNAVFPVFSICSN